MFSTFFSDLEPWMQTAAALALLCALAYVLRGVVQWVLRLLVQRWSQHVHVGWAQVLMHEKLLRRLARITPSLVIQTGIGAVPHLPAAYTTGIYNVAIAVTVYHLIQLLAAFLDALNESREVASDSQAAQHRSIKNYVQLGKLLAFLLGGILIVAILLNRSPLLLLSGLGAMSAVLMLVFKDTILSFTAGVQLSSNDMLRMGDWIEMPQVGADGAVIDIALHTVKVQNWDKTITTIPTWRLMSDSYRNWRGMSESGGRRIKRTLRIDGASIGFLDEAQLSRLQRIGLLAPYLAQKRDEIAQDNATRFQQLGSDAKEAANRRQLTNIGTFRAYVDVYLRAHPGIHQDMLLMARTLEPSPEGVPLELYCFTATTAWVQYERIQGDIFDHLLAILPEFGLRLFQSPSGHDIVQGLHSRPGAPDPRLATATPN